MSMRSTFAGMGILVWVVVCLAGAEETEKPILRLGTGGHKANTAHLSQRHRNP